MRVAIKLALALLVCASLVLAGSAWLSVRREVGLIEEDVRRETRGWGQLAVELIRQVRKDEGDAAARALVERLPQPERAELRWVEVATCELGEADRARLREGEVVTVLHPGDPGEIVTYVALDRPEAGVSQALELRESLETEARWIQGSVLAALATTLATAALFGLLAVLVGLRVVGRPIQELIALARRVGDGDLDTRLALPQRDEIGELAREMNAMCDHLQETRLALEAETAARTEAIDRLRHAERLALVGQLAAGVAHQLGTPLSVVQGRADLIAAGVLEGDEVTESGRVIGNLCRRMAGVVRQTLDYARRRPANRSEHDLRRLTRRMLELLSDVARREEVEVEVVSSPEPLTAEIDPAQLEQALANLLVNAIQASPAGSKVLVSVELDRRAPPPEDGVEPTPAREVVVVSIRDQGCGISEEDRVHLWEPFFTTKAVGEGTGLGLPIAKGIVEEHGGWIEVESQPDVGSEFRAILPREENQ